MIELKLNGDTRYGKSTNPRSRWKTTVSSSTFSTFPFERIPWNADSAAELILGSVRRSNVATTSSTVIGVPSCHLTLCRILNAHVSGACGSQEVARRGSSLYSGSGKHRYSPATCAVMIAPVLNIV